MNSEDLAGATYKQLYDMRKNFECEMLAANVRIAAVNDEIAKRLLPEVERRLHEGGADYGTVNMALQDGIAAKCVIDKKVEWDSEKLLALAQTMPWDRVRDVFKIAFAVPEKIYGGIKAANPELAAEIDKARTVKPGKPKFTLLSE